MRNILLSLFTLITLTGCAKSDIAKYSKKEFEKNEKAVVFFDIYEKDSSLYYDIVRWGEEKVK